MLAHSGIIISSGTLSVIVGSILTFMGLVVLGFIGFFLSRLINQLDENTESLKEVATLLAVLQSRVESLEHKTLIVSTKEEPT